jgi:hypothetical protein
MPSPTLARKTFLIPRAAEFVSEDELAKLIGHAPDEWLEVILKELADNTLDDAEEHGVAPVVEVAVDTAACTVVVADQGSGIDPKTVTVLADLNVRVSSRAAYIAPSRGAQGNAWQTLIAMPYALDPERPGDVVIEARGVRHRLSVVADPVERIPRVVHERVRSAVKKGARVTTRWPERARSHRVELNAMSSNQIVALIEAGFARHGVAKAVPDAAVLGEAFAAFERGRIAKPVVERWLTRLQRRAVEVPEDLEARVRAHLRDNPELSWDAALRDLVELGSGADQS